MGLRRVSTLSHLQGPRISRRKDKNHHLHGLQEKQCLHVKTMFQFEKTGNERRNFVERVLDIYDPVGSSRDGGGEGRKRVRVVHAWNHMGWGKCGNLRILAFTEANWDPGYTGISLDDVSSRLW